MVTFDKIIPAAQNLGLGTAGYGVMPRHYEAVGAALLSTPEQGLDSAFTPKVKDAWTPSNERRWNGARCEEQPSCSPVGHLASPGPEQVIIPNYKQP